MKTINPKDLLTHKRFDIAIKYLYASNLSSDYYKKVYREHAERPYRCKTN
jgi:hypothetical protein